MIDLRHGDCLELMASVADGSIDLILCDLPFGTTACAWDVRIPFEPLWAAYKRIIKPNGAIVLTASQPFTSALVMSNPKWFRYEWIWHKTMASGFLHAKNRPLKAHENVLVFSPAPAVHASQTRLRLPYFPQMREGKPYKKFYKADRLIWGNQKRPSHVDYHVENEGGRYPVSVLDFPNPNKGSLHPTQKPVLLMEYLIRTYTNERETVLDCCMGSGTTGVACAQTGRRFIGMEKDAQYFEIASARICSAERATA